MNNVTITPTGKTYSFHCKYCNKYHTRSIIGGRKAIFCNNVCKCRYDKQTKRNIKYELSIALLMREKALPENYERLTLKKITMLVQNLGYRFNGKKGWVKS